MPDGEIGTVQRLATYICTARGQPFSAEVGDAALRCIFDLLVATVASLDDPGSVAARSVAQCIGEGVCPI